MTETKEDETKIKIVYIFLVFQTTFLKYLGRVLGYEEINFIFILFKGPRSFIME